MKSAEPFQFIMKRMGPLITLQLYAIDLEAKQKSYDAALARLDKVAAASPRKETWLARKGEILQLAGRPEQAADAFQAALKAIAQLPDTRRYVPAMQELEKRIQAVLREHEILLVLDEVVTAYGRTGHWFAAELYGIEPDVVVTAKALTS